MEIENRMREQDTVAIINRDLRDRYSREHPEVRAQQQVLFEELKAAGLIVMLEHVIFPDTLYVQPTADQRSKAMEEMLKRAKKLPPVLPQELSRKVWDDMWNQKWQGSVLYPLQKEDGSLDPTLRISMDDQVLDNFFGKSYEERHLVEITYTQERILTIKGENEIVINLNSIDATEMQNVLDRALANPQIVPPIPLD